MKEKTYQLTKQKRLAYTGEIVVNHILSMKIGVLVVLVAEKRTCDKFNFFFLHFLMVYTIVCSV